MIKKLIYAFGTGCLLVLVGILGFLVPGVVSYVQDKNSEGSTESVVIDEVVLNYGTEFTLTEKLKLFRDNFTIYTYGLTEFSLTASEAEQTVRSYLASVITVDGDAEVSCIAEPVGLLFENGETLSVCYVHFVCGDRFEGNFILDDQSGMILGFHIVDLCGGGMAEALGDEGMKNAELSVETFAEELIKSYDGTNCGYENGYIYFDVSGEESLRFRLSGDLFVIEFNNGYP